MVVIFLLYLIKVFKYKILPLKTINVRVYYYEYIIISIYNLVEYIESTKKRSILYYIL